MINNEELLCVVDEFDTPIEPRPRNEVFANGLWRRTAQVWLTNHKGKLLCQRRSLKKDRGAGMWEVTVAGHIGPEDNYFTGAVREVNEETGLNITPSDLKLIKIYKADEFKEYRGIFHCNIDVDLHYINKEHEEVDEVKFMSVSTIKHYLLYKKHENWISPGYEKEIFPILENK